MCDDALVLWPSRRWHLLQHVLFSIHACLRLRFGCILWGPWHAGAKHSEGSPVPLGELWTLSVPCSPVLVLFDELCMHSCGTFGCQPTVTAVLCKVSGLAETLYGPLNIQDDQGAKHLRFFCPNNFSLLHSVHVPLQFFPSNYPGIL